MSSHFFLKEVSIYSKCKLDLIFKKLSTSQKLNYTCLEFPIAQIF